MSDLVLPGLNGQHSGAKDAGQQGTRQFVAKPVLACDLDGTIRHNCDDEDEFINDAEDICFYPGVIEALWIYRDEGWLPVAVSNQGGVAWGHLSKKDLDKQMNQMQTMARKADPHGRGWPFLDTRFCMYDERADDPMYGHRSLHRKPRYGMLAGVETRAKANGVIPMWDESVMIGDREEDEEMAENAGIAFWPADQWREEVQAKLLDEDGNSTAGEPVGGSGDE